MRYEENFVTMKLIWHNYPVSNLDKCVHMKFSLRLFLRTRIMIDGIQLPLSAWLSCTTLGDSTNAMIVMATTNRALVSLALGSVIVDLALRLSYACLYMSFGFHTMLVWPSLYRGRWLDQI